LIKCSIYRQDAGTKKEEEKSNTEITIEQENRETV
jgi:hypothetical protein